MEVTQNLIRNLDNTPPTASNLEDFTLLGCNAVFPDPDPALVLDEKDACGTPTVTFVSDTAPILQDCSEKIIRTYKVMDACNNFMEVTQNLIRNLDSSKPIISALPLPTFINCEIIPQFSVPTVTDDCGSKIELNYVDITTSRSCANSYTITRKWTAKDACENSSFATQIITIQDTEAPVFTSLVPVHLVVSCDVIPKPETIQAVDNCGTVNIIFSETKEEGACSSNFTLKRKWTAHDSCGNISNILQEIIVSDTEPPKMVVPFEDEINVSCDQIPPLPTLEFVDNCSGIDQIVAPSNSGLIIHKMLASHTLIREWKVSDLCGNSHTFTQRINVNTEDNIESIQYEACNKDQNLINLNAMLPVKFVGKGIWKDVSKSGGLDSSNSGLFSPYGQAEAKYILEYLINEDDCNQKIQIEMIINSSCVTLTCGNIVVHNAFSPNNDGINDVFTIDSIDEIACYPTNQLKIYNRWGILVYETNEYDNNTRAFRGISEGRTTIKQAEELPAGTYFYSLEYTSNGEKVKNNGYLYLSR